jgi:hypothetical protein
MINYLQEGKQIDIPVKIKEHYDDNNRDDSTHHARYKHQTTKLQASHATLPVECFFIGLLLKYVFIIPLFPAD